MKKSKVQIFNKIKFEYKITIIYFIIGFLWIYFSDTFFDNIIVDKQILTKIHIAKGSVYVFITSLLLYFFVKRHMNKLQQSELLTKHRNEEIEAQYEEYKQLNIELQKSIEKTEESETFLTNIFENIPNMIFVKNADDLRFVRFNKAGENLLGYTREELIGKNDYDFFPAEEADSFTINDREVFKTDKPLIIDEEITKTKYGIRILYTKKIAIKDKNGNNKYLLGISEDITAKKQNLIELIKAKEKVEESENKFSAITNQASEGIALSDLNGNFIFVNPAFCNMTGYSEEELLKMSVFDLKANSQPSGIFEESKTIKDAHPLQVVLKRKDETELYTEIVGRIVKINNQDFVLGIVRDITERKKFEEELLKSEKEFRTLAENSPDVIVRYDTDCRRIYVNPEFERVNHLTAKEVYGIKPIELSTELAPRVNEFTEKLMAVLKSGTITKIDLTWQKEGKQNCWYVRIIPEFDAEGNVKSALTIWTDITDRMQADLLVKEKNAEYLALNEELTQRNNEYFTLNEEYITINKELKQTNDELLVAKEKAEESNHLKTAFLQNISHEIRTPMNAIIGFSALLNNDNLSSEKRKHFTTIIQNSTHQLLSIVTDILTISTLEKKQEILNIKPICVNNIIADLLSLFKIQAATQNISFSAKPQLTNEQSEIYTDNTKVTQILTNLITNALKFTHTGFIEFGYNLKTDIELAEMEFYVKDSGIGIKHEMQEKIFERFIQADKTIHANYGGTGLGLSISKGFVDLLGGKIWVQSELEKGSIFYFTIPYKPVHENDKINIISNQTENKKRSKTILVAEDDQYNYLFIEEVLIEMDLKLIHAKNGKETVEICKTNPEIDLILMDIKMPILDGHTAAKIIRESCPDIHIIAQTAYALEHEKEKYSGTTFDDYITKPINKDELIQTLLKYIDS